MSTRQIYSKGGPVLKSRKDWKKKGKSEAWDIEIVLKTSAHLKQVFNMPGRCVLIVYYNPCC